MRKQLKNGKWLGANVKKIMVTAVFLREALLNKNRERGRNVED